MPEGLRTHLAVLSTARCTVVINGADASRGGQCAGKVSGLSHRYEMIVGPRHDQHVRLDTASDGSKRLAVEHLEGFHSARRAQHPLPICD